MQIKQGGAQKVLRDGQKLVNGQHFDSATIKYKISRLDQFYTLFSEKLQQQQNVLNQAVKFMRSSVPVSIDSILKLVIFVFYS